MIFIIKYNLKMSDNYDYFQNLNLFEEKLNKLINNYEESEEYVYNQIIDLLINYCGIIKSYSYFL